MNKLAFIGGCVLLVLWSVFSTLKLIDLNGKLDTVSDNLLQLEADNREIYLEQGKLTDYLQESQTKQAQEIRSFADSFNIKLKNIEKANVQTIKFVDRYIPQDVIHYDSIYVDTLGYKVRPFSLVQPCYSLAGNVEFSDSIATLNVDSLSYELDVVNISYKKRKWYNPVTWFRPEVKEISASTCGTLNYTRINTLK